MSNLVYDGSNGLFTRLGKLIDMMNAVRTHQNDLKTKLAAIQGVYSTTDAYMIERLAGNIETRIAEAGYVLSDVRHAAEQTLIEMCYASAADSNSTLPMRARTVTDALTWLIRAMDGESTPEKVNGTTVTKSSLSVGASNSGNGKFYYSLECPNVLLSSIAEWPNVRTEVIEARCSLDASGGEVAAGSEGFIIKGQPSVDPLDYRFPQGSGASISLFSISASVDNGQTGQNVLTYSDMESYAQNTPTNFTVSTGAHGTDFKITTTAANVFRGSAALEMPAAGTFKLRQQFGVSTGTLATLAADRLYILAAAVKKDAGATGTFRISLQDASGNVLDSGNCAMTLTIGTAFGTSYAIEHSIFRTPRIMPTTTYLVVETTTAVAVASAYVDEIVLAEMIQTSAAGPAFAIICGSTNWALDDNARYTFTNLDEGKFVRAFDRLFDMYGKGLALPQNTTGTETILDSLIT